AVSKDNGTTWSVTTIPGSTTQDEGDPSVAVDKNNTAFECYQDGSSNTTGSTAKMASYNPSTGQWGASTDIGALVGVKNIQFPAAVAGDAGHAACAFLGTSTGGAANYSAWATVAYQTGGDPLIGATTTTTQPPSTAPTLTATAGTGAVDLSWTAVSGATSYDVYRGTTAGGESTTPLASVSSGK